MKTAQLTARTALLASVALQILLKGASRRTRVSPSTAQPTSVTTLSATEATIRSRTQPQTSVTVSFAHQDGTVCSMTTVMFSITVAALQETTQAQEHQVPNSRSALKDITAQKAPQVQKIHAMDRVTVRLPAQQVSTAPWAQLFPFPALWDPTAQGAKVAPTVSAMLAITVN